MTGRTEFGESENSELGKGARRSKEGDIEREGEREKARGGR